MQAECDAVRNGAPADIIALTGSPQTRLAIASGVWG